MKAIGIVRKVDELGRIVIPKELRKSFNVNEGDPLEIYTDGDNIILKKYTPGCHCCKNTDNLIEVLGLKLCPSCLDQFNEYRKLVDKARGEK